MNDMLKILFVIALGFGAWTMFVKKENPFTKGPPASTVDGDVGMKHNSRPRAQAKGKTVTQAEVNAAKRDFLAAQQKLAQWQNTVAGAGTTDRTVTYNQDWRITQTRSFSNSSVQHRSAMIKQATQEMQEAQQRYVQLQQQYAASKKK